MAQGYPNPNPNSNPNPNPNPNLNPNPNPNPNQVTFSKPTNRDVATDERRYVDSLFTFEPDIGDEYSGEWLDDSTFLVTVLAAGAHAPALNESRAAVRGDIFGREHGRQVALALSLTLSLTLTLTLTLSLTRWRVAAGRRSRATTAAPRRPRWPPSSLSDP